MRVLVCGSRTWTDAEAILRALVALERLPSPATTIVHGGAPLGADALADTVARSLGYRVEVFRADWQRYGRRAGILRNLDMLDSKPDRVLAFWDGRSPGTHHTIEAARYRKIPVEVIAPA